MQSHNIRLALANILVSPRGMPTLKARINSATAGIVLDQDFFPLQIPLEKVLTFSDSELFDLAGEAKKNNFFVNVDSLRNNLLPPVISSHFNIFCVGKNYQDHVAEMKELKTAESTSGNPIIFSKALSSLCLPYGNIVLPTSSHEVDYEGELVVVIGKEGKNINPENAMDHIFGYTIMNDVSARDKQKRHVQWHLGKSMDTFTILGPYITPKSSVDHKSLQIETKVNGEIRQKGNTDDMIFKIPELIAKISEDTTLSPGDIIATGTPSGVGAGMKPPQYLATGDEVEISISGLGSIKNAIV